MKPFILFVFASTISIFLFAAPNIPLTKGMVIKESVTITIGTFLLNADTSLKQPLIIIEGNNITVDFNNVILLGSNDKKFPNELYGLAVLIKKGSHHITLKNANIHGFKVAVMADSVEYLVIDNCNLSYNYRQHLHSNWQREDISDWMSYHHNENDEWLRYGAGIYLKNCRHSIIKNNFITGGQCGLMMMRCDSNEIYNNNFSFNSGIGIGLYRSSNNSIYANRVDFNVRGFSDGFYSRGQDSGGILVFEQCNNNVFAYNSGTHSGDGFFLWAGQFTMDTGEGGCNDNWIYDNDFSYAPTNGVEATFSRNKIEFNEIKGCDNGIWAGYSFNTSIFGNKIDSNRIGVAIEHGQYNRITKNKFNSNATAVKFWSREIQPADWKYAQVKDTRSRSNYIYGNEFVTNNTVYDIMGSDSTFLKFNSKKGNGTNYKIGSRIKNFDTSGENGSTDIDYVLPYEITKIKSNSIPKNNFNPGRNQIRITEYGPYNYQYPILWLKNIDSNKTYHFEILGPPDGKIKIKKAQGFFYDLSGQSGSPKDFIYSIMNARTDPSVQDRFIQIEYKGPAFTDMFGKLHEASQSYIFEYREFDPVSTWDINFYKWDALHDPYKDFSTFMQSLGAAIYTTATKKIDYTWWGTIDKNLPADSFATVATTTMDLREGDYEISVTADDLVKIYIDRKLVINAWDAYYTDLDENTHHSLKIFLDDGKHDFKIVHAENNGLATLMFYIRPLTVLKEKRASE